MSEHMNDRQFAKAFAAAVAGMIALTFVLMIIAYVMSSEVRDKLAAEKQVEIDRIVAARIQPVGSMSMGTEPIVEAIIPSAQADTSAGETTYNTACVACHAAGVAGAPIPGDAAQWADRIAQGTDKLYENAINGFQGETGLMPPKGGNTALSDDEVKAAVDYMLEQVQ